MKIRIKYFYAALALLATSLGMSSCGSEDDPTPDTESKTNVSGRIPSAEEAVDLGLSVKWAPWNVGAVADSVTGSRFAWGEVETKTSYGWDNYKWIRDWYSGTSWWHFTLGGIDEETDAATVNWGVKWRMPTFEEVKELRNQCSWKKKAAGQYAESYPAGYLVTGPNGNSIFFAGEEVACWSKSVYPYNAETKAYCIWYPSAIYGSFTDGVYATDRCTGLNVRAVLVEE